jgi:hypothetical protein
MNFSKLFYYLLLKVTNITAFFLIGISFLSGPPALNEKEIAMWSIISRIDPFIRLCLYIIIVSIIFSAIAYALSYLFQKSLLIEKNKLRKIFLVELALFIGAFIIAYSYVYVRFRM